MQSKDKEREYIANKVKEFLAKPVNQIKQYSYGLSTCPTSPYILEEAFK